MKRFLDEICDRQNHAAQVPRPDRYISKRDLLDLAELAFDDDDVVDKDWLRQSDLNSGEHVAERLLGGETDNDARDPGRGENAGAELPDGIEQHQDGT